jgi:alpha-L-arabinofuranosidase
MYRIITLGIITYLCLLLPTSVCAQETQGGKQISSDLFGLFFEDINYAADGGLYAELVQNRSFEYNQHERPHWHPLAYWQYISPGFSVGRISVENEAPVHPNNPTYAVLHIELVGNYPQFEGESGAGLRNSGFGGMVIREGEQFNFSIFARLDSEEPMDLLIMLENSQGDEIGRASATVTDTEWEKYTASLTATADSDSASLVVLAQTAGVLAVDMISLFPENTFMNRPNGLRADLAQKLADMQPAFIRFPGGCLVHGDGLGNMYRWNNTVGPIEQRRAQRNIWGYHQTGGLGYFEYFQFAEDIGAKPIPIVPAGVCCQNSGGTHVIGSAGQRALPMYQMDAYIQEVLDLIEWANGPATSRWGAKRAAAGRPEPFNLEYIGVGNEDKMTPEFLERFRMIYNAINEKHPEIIVIGSSGPYPDGEDFDIGWGLANELNLPVVDEHYYREPEWYLANHYRYDDYDRDASKVYLGEYASWGNALYNAIVEATYMTSFERNGDLVIMASYAPLFAKRGFTQWNTNLIFFDNVNIIPTPNYYVQKMFMTNRGDLYFDDVIAIEEPDTLRAASCVVDSRTGDVILKLVNAGSELKTMSIDLSQFGNIQTEAMKTVLTGDAEAENTFANPENVIPEESQFKVSGKFDYDAPPMSLTVIRIGVNSSAN